MKEDVAAPVGLIAAIQTRRLELLTVWRENPGLESFTDEQIADLIEQLAEMLIEGYSDNDALNERLNSANAAINEAMISLHTSTKVLREYTPMTLKEDEE